MSDPSFRERSVSPSTSLQEARRVDTSVASSSKLIGLLRKTYELYRNNELVNLNSNVLIAAYPSIQAASKLSEYLQMRGFSDSAIAGWAAAADWVVYMPVHLGFHYASKRHKFIEDGNLNKKEFFKDVGRVYLTQIPSIVLFYAMAGPLQYYLMKHGVNGENANLLSYWGTLVATRTFHTFNYLISKGRNLPKSENIE